MFDLSRRFTTLLLIVLLGFLSACNQDEKKSQGDKKETTTSSESTKTSSEETTANGGDSTKDQTKFNWFKLSGWHTRGAISRNSPVRIVFNREVISDEQIGKDASRVMKVSPNISGKPIFETKTEIV